jgi:ABC-type transport system substrate-binding protein
VKQCSKGILVLGFAVAVSVIFVVMAGETAAKERGVLVVGDSNPTTNLDPATSNVSNFVQAYRHLFQGLVRYKFNSTQLEGDLAKGWSMSRDGMVYTFTLRDHIKWHKGFGKVTAHDVKFSFDRIMDSKTGSVYFGEVAQTVKEVKVVDDLTVEIHLKDRDASFLHRCARPKPVAIVSQKAVEKYGKDFARNPIGSGPFVFESMSREELVLTANKEYHEGPPKVEKVIFKAIPDTDTRAMALIRGEIDIITNLTPEQTFFDRVKAAGCNIKMMDYGAWFMVLINPRVEPLGDLRVRRAIAHAIDKDEIVKHLFVSGALDRLDSLVPKGYLGHTEEGLRRYNYDPKKAKELLVEAGYPNGFEVKLDIPTPLVFQRIGTAIQNQLAKAGINARLDVTDLPTFNKKVSSGASSLCIFGPARIPDADSPLVSFFHGASSAPGLNLARYNKLDRDIQEARTELNPSKRLKMYHEIQKKLMEDLPAIPLFSQKFPTAYRSNVVGLPPDNRDPVWGIDAYHIYFKE